MEYVLLILGFCLIIVGIIGSILPVLPGLPISWLGLFCLYFVPTITFNHYLLGITLFFTLLVSIIDYIIPSKGTKKFGGTKYGVWGTNIGLVLGLFIPIPFGFIIAAFLGAFIGELIYNTRDQERAFKAAIGAFTGFLAGTFMKLFYGILLLIIYIWLVIQNWEIWF